jgi:amino acid permease
MASSVDHDQEKYIAEVSSEKSSVRLAQELQEGLYHKEELLDPDEHESLQRGLSARQISMIAVSTVKHPLSLVAYCDISPSLAGQ